ncbi:LuxR C-terminal-related transcriptional regulator [Kitasatospora sp. NBC_00240]|uniref:ATP-binding protein n=1 Tax=Kitasatospora sp. NBC_00240 TaxID=2903567 RepID=UPI0022533536|nr:LuxR C-terminal-related transcriptional regulator [Kitasatospora sp. NBC_00240]MCX5215416.1 LuxR C-terminal-related transcriptional regulator [Kitasatospora sp. NBC_00240]
MSVLADRLPADVTSLVGRRAELAELKRVLEESRLVTLTGIGGVGKTRLALQVAREVRRAFPDGVFWVSLAEVGERGLVALTVMDAVGLRTMGPEATTVLVDYMRDKRLLLVLDNCEHLVEACADLAAELLPACPGVRVLATSREVLDIGGERTFVVAPLPVPEEDEGPDRTPTAGAWSGAVADAMALFADRAAAAVPGFEVTADNAWAVAALCRHLDGLPLAIELAAVRMRALSVEELLRRQDERYELLTRRQRGTPLSRHRSLRATVDWSFELCSPEERLLWARLSVFAGGCDLNAAESVCAREGLTRDAVLDVMAGLVEKSIITREEHHGRARYRMLETIRQYGREQLRDTGEEPELRRRHRDHYQRLAERVQEQWFGPGQVALFASTRTEHANLRAAMEYSLTEPGQAPAGLHMASSLWIYWIVCGLPREGTVWLERALARNEEPDRIRAVALWAASLLNIYGGNPAPETGVDEVITMAEESRRLAEQLADPALVAHATYLSGFTQLRGSDLAQGLSVINDGIELERAFGESNPHLRFAQFMLTVVATQCNLVDVVVTVGEECRTACRKLGDEWVRSWISLYLGAVGVLQARDQEAENHLREAIQLKEPFNELLGLGTAVEFIGWCSIADGDVEKGTRLLGAATVFVKQLGFDFDTYLPPGGWGGRRDHRTVVAEAKASLGEAAYARAFESGARLSQEEAIALALGTEVVPEKSTAGPGDSPLTRREEQIAELLAEGLSNKEIAERLVVAQRTAETHVANILTKLGCTSRSQVAVWVTQRRRAAAERRNGDAG